MPSFLHMPAPAVAGYEVTAVTLLAFLVFILWAVWWQAREWRTIRRRRISRRKNRHLWD